MTKFRSRHRFLARPNSRLTFVDGELDVADREDVAAIRRLAQRRPYLGIEEVIERAPAPKPMRVRKPKAEPPPADDSGEPYTVGERGPELLEPATPAEEPATPADESGPGDGPASSEAE